MFQNILKYVEKVEKVLKKDGKKMEKSFKMFQKVEKKVEKPSRICPKIIT